MRIVAGTAGGLQLKGPQGSATRPTTDKVRGAIFNALGSADVIDGATVVDLFAGTGACGIEALSRGAASAVFVEKNPKNVALIRANLEATKLQERADVRIDDVMAYVRRSHRFDVAFADPPYEFDQWAELLTRLTATVVVCESNRPVEVDSESGWTLERYKRYGDTDVTILRAIGRGEAA